MATIFALKVTQPIGEFYLASVEADFLVGRVQNRPRRSGDDKNVDIQRIFSPQRINQIASFTQDPDATFPTPIILAVDSATVRQLDFVTPLSQLVETKELNAEEEDAEPKPVRAIEESEKKRIDDSVAIFNIPDTGMIGDVLDGQHRVLGLEKSSTKEKFQLPIVLMFDLDPEDKAYVFSIINSKQTPVSSSQIYDLFELAEHRSPRKTCHMVAHALNRDPGSPLFNKIKMLGRREDHHTHKVMLSQGTFAARLLELLSSDPDGDSIAKKAKKELPQDSTRPLRKYWLNEEDEVITKILLNYFQAIRDHFPAAWDDDSGAYLIRKSVGYTGFMKLLKGLLPQMQEEKKLSYEAFHSKLGALKTNLAGKDFTSAYFASNDSGAKAIANALMGR